MIEHRSAFAGEGRRERVEEVYRRGLAAARRAYVPERHLVGNLAPWAGGKTVFRPPGSVWLAHALLREGDLEEAARIVSAALDTQERAPRHPHRGNFLWLADDEEVVDLNAIQFMLRALLPLLVEHGQRLPQRLQERCREAVRLALEEQERMAVAPTYTNIHLMSLFALVVGAEWLGDAHFLALGKARWAAWVRFTAGSGAPHEYNSPGYGMVDLSALAALHQYARDDLVKLQARLMYERLWLHVALHLHPPTGQQAGPHCRCYWHMMTGAPPAVVELLWRETGRRLSPREGGAGQDAASLELALTEHWLPDAARVWLERFADGVPATVRETANRAEGADLTTYLTRSYALGTASRTYSIGQDDFYIEHQANYLALHYVREADPKGWGLVYSRYVVNDRHYGTLSAAPDRPPNAFYDQGTFAGAQVGNKAIALYALQPQHEEVFSLKTVVVFPAAAALEEIWLGGRRVRAEELPLTVPEGEWLVVVDGAVRVGVRPLEHSCLGREASVVLERGPNGELWLTAYNYRGPAKRFWDYASLRGAFWRGNVRAGYVLEVAERTEHATTAMFLTHLQSTVVEDVMGGPDEVGVEGSWLRTVSYRSGDDEVSLRYDLWNTRLVGRRLNGEEYLAVGLDSPIAAQGGNGRLRAGSAVLETAALDVWLVAQDLEAGARFWQCVNPEDRATALRLETPLGIVTAERWGVGSIELREKEEGATVVVRGLAPPEGLRVPDGVAVVFE